MSILDDIRDATNSLEDAENTLSNLSYEYLTPLEDIVEEIAEITSNPYFTLDFDNSDPVVDIYRCTDCGKYLVVNKEKPVETQNEEVENFPHTKVCKLNKLKDLVATLVAMVS